VKLSRQWAFKVAKGERGYAANRSEYRAWVTASPKRRELLCPSIKLIRDGQILVAKRVQVFEPGQMSLELYIQLGMAWKNEAPHDDAPFEPGDRNWGWLDGRPVAIDYALSQSLVNDHYNG
jgi:hypothetical protein